jgi:hypothetical protein
VIVDGIQHVHPADVVDAKEMTPASDLTATSY